MDVAPLSEALFMGKTRHEIKEDGDDEEMVWYVLYVFLSSNSLKLYFHR